MNNTLAEEKKVCTCGRGFSHCKHCGSKNVYVKKTRSFEVSDQLGKQIYVYGCRRCMRETQSEGQECKALPVRDFNPAFTTEIKAVKVNVCPWGNLVPGSEEYLNLFCEEASNIRDKKHVNMHEAYATLIKAGWPLAVENMDEELKEYLKSKGLLTVAAGDVSSKEQEASMRGADPQSPPSSEASLDEIIKAMNEEQK